MNGRSAARDEAPEAARAQRSARTRLLWFLALLPLGYAGAIFLSQALFAEVGFVSSLTSSASVAQDDPKLADIRLGQFLVLFQLAMIVLWMGLWRRSTSTPADLGLSEKTFSRCLVVAACTAYAPILIVERRLSQFGVMAAVAIAVLLIRRSFAASNHASDPATEDSRWENVFALAFALTSVVTCFALHAYGLRPDWVFPISLVSLALGFARVRETGFGMPLIWSIVVLCLSGGALLSAPYFWLPLERVAHFTWLDGGFALIALLALIQGSRAISSPSKPFGKGASRSLPSLPLALAVTAVTPVPVNLMGLVIDDYHFGEKLLATQAIREGWGFFTDFYSPHGLIDGLGGVVAALGNDTSASGVLWGENVSVILISLAVYVLFIRLAGPVVGCVMGALLPVSQDIPSTLAIAAMLSVSVWGRSWWVGATNALIAAAAAFAAGALGAAAALMAFILSFARHVHNPAHFLGGAFLASVAVAAVFWPQLTGWIDFLLVSSSENLSVFGNRHYLRIHDWGITGSLLFVTLFSFGPSLIFAAGGENLAMDRTRTEWNRMAYALLVLSAFVVGTLLLNEYAMGRLDEAGMRGRSTTLVLYPAIGLWLASRLRRQEGSPEHTARARAGILVAIMLPCSVYPPGSAITHPLLRNTHPTPRHADPPDIASAIPRLGYGTSETRHLERVLRVHETVHSFLGPGETFLNLSNRNSFHFYLGLPSPVSHPSPYNAAPAAFQRDVVDDLEASRPPLVLVDADNFIEGDYDKLSVRDHTIFRFLLAEYVPFEAKGDFYAIHRSAIDRVESNLSVRSLSEYRLHPATDENWSHGIRKPGSSHRWSFAVEPRLDGRFAVGDRLAFSDGVTRRVLQVEGTNLTTEPAIPVELDGRTLSFSLDGDRTTRPEASDWIELFSIRELRRLPSAWGRSLPRLQDQIESVDVKVDISALNHVSATDSNTSEPGSEGNEARTNYRIRGNDPHWEFRFERAILPDEAGLVRIDLQCGDPNILPAFRIYWSAPERGFADRNSMAFEASYPELLIPLDVHAGWLLSQSIDRIRIDLTNGDECQVLSVGRPSLLKRVRDAMDPDRGESPRVTRDDASRSSSHLSSPWFASTQSGRDRG